MESENVNSNSRMEDYQVIEQIGRVAFLVLHKTDNKKYVLKKITLSKQTENFKRTPHQEMNVIVKLRHPYIVEYKDAWVDEGNCICIVTNYCEGGDMSRIIRRARGAYFPEEKVCKWLTQLLLTINYLHSNRVLHRGLKLSNIFLTKENDIRLGDFGLAKLLDEGGLTSSVVRTPNYMCPELLAATPYGYKSDIWSLGCCMFEIAARQPAFRASDMAGLTNKINRSLISPLPTVYSSTLKQIIKSMLRKSPEHRPTVAELLRHPHLQPYLLQCHNPSTVFLPVKSPSSVLKEKTKKPSPSGSGSRKQRDLLPLFGANTDMQYPNLLEGDVMLEDDLETKRVDPTSYSGKISHDSDVSKSLSAPPNKLLIGEDEHSLKQTATFVEIERSIAEETENKPASATNDNAELIKGNLEMEFGKRTDSLPAEEEVGRRTNQELMSNASLFLGSGESKSEGEIVGPQRADVLESLLELCARLLKQDKFNELCGVLKPFGEDTASSRETAIWLSKSLMKSVLEVSKEA